MSYTKYTPPPTHFREMLAEQVRDYWEVWEGLPDVAFVRATDRSGSPALRYDDGQTYVWVPNEATVAYWKNPDTLYLAFREKTPGNALRVPWLIVAEGHLETAIRRAEENNTHLVETKRQERLERERRERERLEKERLKN